MLRKVMLSPETGAVVFQLVAVESEPLLAVALHETLLASDEVDPKMRQSIPAYPRMRDPPDFNVPKLFIIYLSRVAFQRDCNYSIDE